MVIALLILVEHDLFGEPVSTFPDHALAAAAQEPWTVAVDGVLVDVRLTPRGGRDALERIESRTDGRAVIKVRVRAAPFEGEANDALCRLLARSLGVAPRDVTIAAGATARVKRVLIKGRVGAIVAALRRLVAQA